MKLRPILSASAIGLLIAASGAIPAFATEEQAPVEEVVLEAPTAPSTEVEDELSPSPAGDVETDIEDQPEEGPVAEEQGAQGPQDSPVIEYLLEPTPPSLTEPSVESVEPSPVIAESSVPLETFNSPTVEAEVGSNAANHDGTIAEDSSQPMSTIPQNADQTTAGISNSSSDNGSSAGTEAYNAASAPDETRVGPQDELVGPVPSAPLFGTDVLAQEHQDAQEPEDNVSVEEHTEGPSETPGRIESRRTIEPPQVIDATPETSLPVPQDSPSKYNTQDAGSRSAPDARSSPHDDLVTTGTASSALGIGGGFLIAAGIALLTWCRPTSR